MKHIDSGFDKGPTIFKEEITTQEGPLPYSKEPEGGVIEEEEEFVPEIAGVEYDEFIVQKEMSPEKLKPDITSQINVDAQEIREAPSGKDLTPRFEVDVSEVQKHEPLDLRLDLSAFKSSEESDEKEAEDVEVTGEVEIPSKLPEPDFDEQYEFKIPKEGYPYITDKQFAVDMSVRTEDEVSELPESEIASIISDRKEMERRESDVSLSDNEYPEKVDDVSISDSSEESPFTTKHPMPLKKEVEKTEEPKRIIGESDFDISLGTATEIATEATLGTETEPAPEVEKKPQKEELGGVVEPVEGEYVRSVLKQAVDEESPDEYDESIGAIPAKVFGDVYMEEVLRLTDKQIAADTTIQAVPGVESGEKEEAKPVIPEKEMPSAEEEEEYESGEDMKDGVPRPKRKIILERKKDKDKFKAYPEMLLPDEGEEVPKDGKYIYGKGSPRPKMKPFQKFDESESSESEETTSPSEGSFLIPSSDSHRQSEESVETSIRSPEEALDSTVEETTESESTIKEEFITKVESLEEQPQQLISVREYISSEEEEPKEFMSTTDSYDFDVRSETPIIETGFSAELELSRITEDEEPEETESESSEVSQESVQEVPGFTFRDETLQKIPEEGEMVDVSLEMPKGREKIPQEGEVIEEAFTVEESLQAEAGLHIEQEVIAKGGFAPSVGRKAEKLNNFLLLKFLTL